MKTQTTYEELSNYVNMRFYNDHKYLFDESFYFNLKCVLIKLTAPVNRIRCFV